MSISLVCKKKKLDIFLRERENNAKKKNTTFIVRDTNLVGKRKDIDIIIYTHNIIQLNSIFIKNIRILT